jgi:hypothetical protein
MNTAQCATESATQPLSVYNTTTFRKTIVVAPLQHLCVRTASCGDRVMSGSDPPTQQLPPPPGSQSQACVLGPGIAGLFIQGIESGLVFAQFSQWFFRAERIESSILTTIVIFVTVLGLYASSGLLTARPHYLSRPVR